MFWSRSEYFHQDPKVLKENWNVIEMYLIGCDADVEYFKSAYDHFILNPDGFDGATIVKDLVDIFDLDLSALRHDFDYYILKEIKGFKWLSRKIAIDFDYGSNMERFGKGIANPYFRVVMLWISTPFYLMIILGKKIKSN